MVDVLVLSTDPRSGRGGIAVSVSSLLAGLALRGVSAEVFITHDPGNGKLANALLFFRAALRVFWYLLVVRCSGGALPAVYLHIGPRGSLLRKYLVSFVAAFWGAKIYTHHHSQVFEEYLQGRGVYNKILLSLCTRSTSNFVLSKWWAGKYYAAGVENLKIIPNCVPQQVVVRREVLVGGERTLLSIGRLVREKNIHLVIEALKSLPENIRLKVAGGGAAKADLVSLVNLLGLQDRVEFLGWVDDKRKRLLYSMSDLMVVPSASDSFGMVFIESLSLGCPVVIGPNPAVEAALEGVDGVFKSASYRSEDVASAILVALSNDLDGQRLSSSCLGLYSVDEVSKKLASAMGF